MRTINLAVFVSGTGSNLYHVLDGRGRYEVRAVVTNKKYSLAVLKAKRRGCKIIVLDKSLGWDEMSDELSRMNIDGILLAGFMKIIPPEFIAKWVGKIINIHPSLLPNYPGLDSIKRAFDDGAELGATVHNVITEVDAGEKVAQSPSIRCETLEMSEFYVHLKEYFLTRKVFETWPKSTINY